MEPERLWALLFHGSEGKVDRDRFMDTGCWDLVNVVCRPGRDDEGKYWPQATKRAEEAVTVQFAIQPTKAAFERLFFEMSQMRGFSEEETQERWNKKHG